MSGVYHEPEGYLFQERDGHDGKSFGTNSQLSGHMIIECKEKLKVSLKQNESEFSYYILEGDGYFVLDKEKNAVAKGDLVLVTPGTKYTFGGQLKMLLIDTPHWYKGQEEVFHEG